MMDKINWNNIVNKDYIIPTSYVIFVDNNRKICARNSDGDIVFQSANAAKVIENCINTLMPGEEIFIKAGNYNIGNNSILFTHDNIKIRGEGIRRTVIQYTGTDAAIKAASTNTLYYSEISDLFIWQAGVIGSGIAVDSTYFSLSKIDRVRIWDFNIGIDIGRGGLAYYNIISDVTIAVSGTVPYGIKIQNNENTVLRTRIGANNGVGIYVSGFSNELISCNVETGAGSTGVLITGGGHDTTVIGIYAEGDNIGLQIDNGIRGTVVLGGSIIDSATANIVDNGTDTVIIAGVQYNMYLKVPAINISTSKITLNGTTLGSVIWSMPFKGDNYKKFVGYLSGYQNNTGIAQKIVFTKTFANIPKLISDDSGGLSTSATTLTLPIYMNSPVTGWIIIEGY